MQGFSTKLLTTMFLTLALTVHAHADENAAENSKIAELAFHRLERLVMLKKIDASFQAKYLNIEFINLEPQNSDDPHYKVVLMQTPDAENNVSSLTLLMDEAGKTLSHEAKFVTTTNTAPAWPDKDPVTLSENALHFVEEEQAKGNPEIAPFFAGLSRMLISQVQIEDNLKAKVVIESSISTKNLVVILNMDGTFGHYVVE